MAQNEMKAKPALPERVRSMEGLGRTATDVGEKVPSKLRCTALDDSSPDDAKVGKKLADYQAAILKVLDKQLIELLIVFQIWDVSKYVVARCRATPTIVRVIRYG